MKSMFNLTKSAREKFMLKPKIDRKVLLFLKKIPAGRVVTYKSIGDRFKVHPRTVGMIMSRNKHPESYPCYKVVKSNGELGGYSGKGGGRRKAELLRKEGVEFTRRIDIKKYLWAPA